MEIDQVAIPKVLWSQAKAGDEAAKQKIREDIVGLELYCHVLVLPGKPEDYAFVTLRELDDLDLIRYVRIQEWHKAKHSRMVKT